VSDLYSVKDVASLFGLKEARLLYWAQTGFVGPSVRRGTRTFYTFQDLIEVKVAKELLEGGLPLQRVRKNLEALRGALPDVEHPLSRLRIVSDGEKVVVRDDDVAFEPTSGQLVLSFTVSSLESDLAKLIPLPTGESRASRGTAKAARDDQAGPPREESSYALFMRALDAEAAADDEAAEAMYRRALARDARLAAAWTNLGNVLERRGRRGEAREAYDKAIELDPDQPEARYNLANLLADTGDRELAIAEYRRVAQACPEFADAHFNLGLLYVAEGRDEEACACLRRYLELDLDPESEWARRASELLARRPERQRTT
jgi:tetratricopeptide (TPR) repeat protein